MSKGNGRSFFMLNSIWVGSVSEISHNIWFVAAIWMGLALVASLFSIWTGVSVALIEIFVGVLAGNFLHLHASNEWINFLAMLGSGVLTFLAGAEIDPRSLKANLRASLLIGVLSFAVPFGVIWLLRNSFSAGHYTRRRSPVLRFRPHQSQWFTRS
jgi:Kef-type K+ transport system membrane component KefB